MFYACFNTHKKFQSSSISDLDLAKTKEPKFTNVIKLEKKTFEVICM